MHHSVKMAQALHNKGLPDEALKLYNVAASSVEQESLDHSHILNKMGLLLRQMHKFSEARELFLSGLQYRQALGASFYCAQSYINLGILHHDMGDADSAHSFNEKGLQLLQNKVLPSQPENLEVKALLVTALGNKIFVSNMIGLKFMRQGKVQLAQSHFETALAIAKDGLNNTLGTVISKNNLALLQINKGNYTASEALMKEVNESSGYSQPRFLVKSKDLAVTLEQIAKLQRENPDLLMDIQQQAELDICKAYFLVKEGKEEEAEAIYRENTKKWRGTPQHLDAMRELASFLARTKQTSKALDCLEEIRSSLSSTETDSIIIADILCKMGFVYLYQRQNKVKAKEVLLQALKLLDEDSNVKRDCETMLADIRRSSRSTVLGRGSGKNASRTLGKANVWMERVACLAESAACLTLLLK